MVAIVRLFRKYASLLVYAHLTMLLKKVEGNS